jgi:hypothetical protein
MIRCSAGALCRPLKLFYGLSRSAVVVAVTGLDAGWIFLKGKIHFGDNDLRTQ